MRIKTFLVCFFLIFSFSCGHADKQIEMNNTSNTGYNLSSPDKTLILPGELDEISDISIMDNGNIACVQDEKGTIFEIDATSGELITRHVFAGPGDFEGLALKGTTAYAVESSGVVYEVKNFNSSVPNVQRFETSLNEENNVEGACIDASGEKLLLLCKDHPGSELDHREYKTAYRFDLTSKKLIDGPFIKVSLNKLKEVVLQKNEKKDKKFSFHPSGIAINPKNGHYYIIASAGKLLVELDAKFKIIQASNLKGSIFSQPEGITFDKQGGMYISNEAKGEKANILYFTEH